jgi:hypothetical protein
MIFNRTFSKMFGHFPANYNVLRTSVILTNGRLLSSAFQVCYVIMQVDVTLMNWGCNRPGS